MGVVDTKSLSVSGVTLALEGRSSSSSVASTAGSQQCDASLSSRLADREVAIVSASGQSFDLRGKYADASPEDALKAYRVERVEAFERILGCRPGNEDVHNLAGLVSDHPDDNEAFEALFHHLKGRSGDIADAYGDDLYDLAEVALSAIEQKYRNEGKGDIISGIDRDKVLDSIKLRLDSDREAVSLGMFRAELADVLGRQDVKSQAQAVAEKIGDIVHLSILEGKIGQVGSEMNNDVSERYRSTIGVRP